MRNPGKALRAVMLIVAMSVVAGNAAAHDYRDGSVVHNHGGDLGNLYALVPNVGGIGETFTANGMRAMSDIRSDPLLINFSSTVNCLEDDEIEFLALEDALKRRVHKRFRN